MKANKMNKTARAFKHGKRIQPTSDVPMRDSVRERKQQRTIWKRVVKAEKRSTMAEIHQQSDERATRERDSDEDEY